jgi:chromate transport protein ChrA
MAMSALCVAITPSAVMMWGLAHFSSAFRNRRDGQAYEIFELFHRGDSA